MKTMKLGKTDLEVPVIAVGCMRINALDLAGAEKFLGTALELGLNFFDHADIYGGGRCEELFAQAIHMNDDVREKIILQSKCGIRNGMYDFSREHIITSVENSLKRLKTDYLDVLLLHRPDALMEPEEVAEAVDALEISGKIRHFGVSNQNPMQMKLLSKYLKQPICANQLQLSITNSTMISAGINVNMENEAAVSRDGYVLDYCRYEDITIQPWSPFQFGFFGGVFLGSVKYPELNAKIDEIAGRYEVSPTTIVMAWLLRHPAKFQPISGTMNVSRIDDVARAASITLSRREWYEIYLAAGNKLP